MEACQFVQEVVFSLTGEKLDDFIFHLKALYDRGKQGAGAIVQGSGFQLGYFHGFTPLVSQSTSSLVHRFAPPLQGAYQKVSSG